MELFNMQDLFAAIQHRPPQAPQVKQEPQKQEKPKQEPPQAPAPKQEPQKPRKATPGEARKTLENIPGLQLNLENSILWISGDTKTHKEAIKAAGARWFPDLKKWYVGDLKNMPKKSGEEIKDALAEKINELKNLNGIKIEICGSWLWISGDTKPYKDVLKASGCKWANVKKMWSYHAEPQAPRRRKGETDYEEIKNKYGCISLN